MAVQVIVVDAGICRSTSNGDAAAATTTSGDDPTEALQQELVRGMEAALASTSGGNNHHNRQPQPPRSMIWGDFRVVRYTGDEGRGPCQDFGALHATGRLLTFLHSDTLLPPQWDTKIQQTLLPLCESTTSSNNNRKTIVQCCAFAFGHDTEHLHGLGYPWGIRAIWFLGNMRAYLLSLPYGDHILSMPASFFRHVGGFPSQPIMEDYALMDLLRQRTRVLPNETLRIIPPPTGRCSVRRWQQWGVVYVTLVNVLIVYRYVAGIWDADDIFEYYYGNRPGEKRKQS